MRVIIIKYIKNTHSFDRKLLIVLRWYQRLVCLLL